jgi:cholest-4-en-3-one 26-monooxygenase
MPVAEAVILSDPASWLGGIPHEYLAQRRRVAPVEERDEPPVGRYWSITRHADVAAVSRDSDGFSSARHGVLFDDQPRELLDNAPNLLYLDPPAHTRLREMVSRRFTPRMIDRLAGQVRRHTAEVIDAVLAGEGEVDLVGAMTARIPLLTILDMMGVEGDADRQMLEELSYRIVPNDDPEFWPATDRALPIWQRPGNLRAQAGFFAYAQQLAERRRHEPKDDLTSALLASVDDRGLTDLEYDLFVMVLLVAGNETVRNALTLGLLELARRPELWQRLADEPSVMDTAIEEILRWSTPVLYMRRTANRELTLNGSTIGEGDRVVLWYASANFDETVFADPLRFDIARRPNPHTSIGAGGPHFCLGAALARLEIRAVLEELIERGVRFEQAGPAERLRSNFLNGIKRAPVRLTCGHGLPGPDLPSPP